MGIKHTFVSDVPDGGNTSLIRPSNWNAEHDVDTSTVTPQTSDKLLIKDVSDSENVADVLISALVTLISAAIVDSAPSTLDTLNELAAALGDDPNFATTVTNALAAKAPLAPRVGTTASSPTPTPDADAHDLYTITALAAAAELQNPSGTPTNGQALIVRIKDDGTARALTFDTAYRAVGATLPTTTVIGKTMYLGMIYNSADSKWDVLGVAEEA
jgi:hypothetical protein